MNLIASLNLWAAASTASGPALRGRVAATWCFLNPTKPAIDLGHAQLLPSTLPTQAKRKLVGDMYRKMVPAALSKRDVIVLNFGAGTIDRVRAGLLANLTPAIVRPDAISTVIRTESFLLELCLHRHKTLTVLPWVFDDTEPSLYEADPRSMNLTWFGFLRPGIDRPTIDVANLIPSGWPDLPRKQFALWLNELFVDEINPTLPAPFRLTPPVNDIDPKAIAQARTLLLDILHVDPTLSKMPRASLSVALPNGAFGIARLNRHSAEIPLPAADRLAVLAHMASEDIKGSPATLDAPYHPDIAPRQSSHAGGITVIKTGQPSAHETIASMSRLTALYHAKRCSWFARWRRAAPDGHPIPDSLMGELDEFFGWVDDRRAA